MKSKKIFALPLVLSLVLALLAACGGGKDNADNEASSAAPTASASPSASASETPKESEPPAWTNEKITLKFASWEDEKVEAAMLKAFMEKYPNITVEKDKAIVWPFEESLATAAAAGNMPDVFWLKDVPLGVQNDWLYDISGLWDADEEALTVYKNTAAAMVYNGKRVASPTFQFVMGVYLNKTLFEKNNVPLPSYNWTIDEMLELAKKFSKPKDYIYGIHGPWGNLLFDEYFPMQHDEKLGYNTWDGEKFHFTSQHWIDGYNKKLELINLKIADVMTGEEKKKEFGDENAWTFQKGHVAMQIDGSWNTGWLPADMQKSGAGDVEFYPYPGGAAGQRMPAILDFIGVSSTTKHPEAAYELSKFMTWGKEGWLKRIDIMKELGIPIDKYPLSDQPEIFAKLELEFKSGGEKEVLKLLPNAVPGPAIPGVNDWWNWVNENKIIEKINSGEFKAADKAKELEDKANEFVAAARDKLKVGN